MIDRSRLLSLLSPASLVMDLNIGAALWLAARGTGRLRIGHGDARSQRLDGTAYTSAAKIVLLGHGADEQCAGYVRHKTKYGVQLRPIFSASDSPGGVPA